jgi:hypothetical protein
LVATGSGTGTVQSGVTNQVDIQLGFIEGDLDVNVTWMIPSKEILAYTSAIDVLRHDLGTVSTTNHGDGQYPFWIDKYTYAFNYWGNDVLSIRDLAHNEINTYNIDFHYGELLLGFYMKHTGQFVFQLKDGTNYDLVIMQPDGSKSVLFTDNNTYQPSSSAVDDWVYFRQDYDSYTRIMRIKSDSTQLDTVRNEANMVYNHPGVSYNGEYLAYYKRQEPEDIEYLMLYHIDTQEETVVLNTTGTYGFIRTVAFNKERSRIYFQSAGNVYSVKLDGTDDRLELDYADDVYAPRLW